MHHGRLFRGFISGLFWVACVSMYLLLFCAVPVLPYCCYGCSPGPVGCCSTGGEIDVVADNSSVR